MKIRCATCGHTIFVMGRRRSPTQLLASATDMLIKHYRFAHPDSVPRELDAAAAPFLRHAVGDRRA